MTKSTLTIAYLIISFILVFFGLAYGTSQVLAYFKTGAENDEILVIDTKSVNDYYQPKITWQPLANEGREMEESTLEKITKDYLASYFHLQHAQRTGEVEGLHDHYTENTREKIAELILEQSPDGRSRGTTIEHNARLDFYSADGSIATLTDEIISFKTIGEGAESYAFYDTSQFQVMLLLEDNFWRTRHTVKGTYFDPEQKAASSPINELFEFDNHESTIKAINYYPQDHPWQLMWGNFDQLPLTEDLSRISALGFNTIRVFVPFHDFGGAKTNPEDIQKLQRLMDQSHQANLKVIVTLFDFFLGYQVEEWTLSDRYAESIANSIKDHPALLAWDVKNEPDLDYESIGEAEVNKWLAFIIRRLKGYDPNTPVTIGWSQPEAMPTLQEEVDFLSFHYYREPKDLNKILEKMKLSKPLFLGETGRHSFNKWWYPFKNSAEEQKEFYEEIGHVIEERNLHYGIWTLYDFKNVPSNVAGKWPWQKGPQKAYGIVDQKDNEKPAYEWVKTFNHSQNER